MTGPNTVPTIITENVSQQNNSATPTEATSRNNSPPPSIFGRPFNNRMGMGIDTGMPMFFGPSISPFGHNPYSILMSKLMTQLNNLFSSMSFSMPAPTFMASNFQPGAYNNSFRGFSAPRTIPRATGSRTQLKPEVERYVPMIKRIITQEGLQNKLDYRLIMAIMNIESGGKIGVQSHKGAGGLMQLMPATARAMGVRDRFNPEQNIRGGVRYFANQLKTFNNRKDLALAAYNAGPGAVKKYKGVPPFRETRDNYLPNVLTAYENIKKKYPN